MLGMKAIAVLALSLASSLSLAAAGGAVLPRADLVAGRSGAGPVANAALVTHLRLQLRPFQ